MEQAKSHAPRLYNTSLIEIKKDELEEKYDRSYSVYQSVVSGLSEKEAHDALNKAIAKDKMHEEAVSVGLLMSILTDPSHAPKSWRDLTLISRDGLGLVQVCLTQLVVERWPRLTDTVRGQSIWLVKELMRSGVTGMDNLCWNLMRYMTGGDVSAKNIFLVESVLDILIENRAWLEKFPLIVATAVYTYLRLLEDHISPTLSNLQKKEVNFLVSLIRERFNDCLMIGRDFVRLLQNVARIPEFETLWRDLLHNPKMFSPNFTGIISILQTRTSRRFLQSRLTPDMEQKVVFLTSNVKFGNHKRYQDWFQRQYLSTPESQSLRCDLIRFIVGVIHPTNELLSSDIIPRWAVIGWLLATCTSSVATANSKLALFYDWLFFDPEKDNIMNIEPAILVIHNSLRSHPAVTATLLDFLCRIIPNFYPPFAERVKNGIYTSLKQILEKRVLPSVYPLFANPKLDRELKALIHETFPEFCFPPPMEGGRLEDARDDEAVECGPPDLEENHTPEQPEAVFSDDEGSDVEEVKPELPIAKLQKVTNKKLPSKKKIKEEIKKEDDIEITKCLEGDLRQAVESLNTEKDNETRCETMEKIVQLVIEEEDDESDVIPNLAKCLCQVLELNSENKVFPESVSLESLEDSIGKPLFVLMRNLAELTALSDSRRHPLNELLVEMHSITPRIGYLLLYYVLASTASDEMENSKNSNRNDKMRTYMEFCHNLNKVLDDCIMDDLKLCQEDDVQMLCWLAPGVYNEFPQFALGESNLLHLVVSCVDARQLQELVCMVVQGRLIMLREDSLQNILTSSLMWETFEQICLWQLVTAHSMSIDSILPVLTKLDFASHAEALTAILLMLQQEKPTAELVKQVLSRDVGPHCDLFVVSVLLSWCREHEERLGELIGTLLSSRCPAGGSAAASPTKRKRATTRASAAPTAERILSHLDRLRPSATKLLYKSEAMQKALHLAQSACTDSQKSQFCNLFALLEVEESGRGKGGGRGRRPAAQASNKRTASYVFSDSSEVSTEDEDSSNRKISRIIKSKATKKRRKVVGSDSE